MAQLGSAVRQVSVESHKDQDDEVPSTESSSEVSASPMMHLIPDEIVIKRLGYPDSFDDPLEGLENYSAWKENLKTALQISRLFDFFVVCFM